MSQFFRKHFNRETLALNYPSQAVFTSSTFLHQGVFVFYRLAMSAYTIGWIIAGGVAVGDHNWAVYLTNWSYLILTLFFFLSFLASLHALITKAPTAQDRAYELKGTNSTLSLGAGSTSSPLPIHFRILWVIYIIAVDAAIVVLILYWGLVYQGSGIDEHNVNKHAVNAVLAVLEILVGDLPHRLAHVYVPVLYGISYIVMSLIFWGAGGTVDGLPYIYTVLDYSNAPGKAVLYIFIIIPIFLPFIHSVVSGLHYLRNRFFRLLNDSDSNVAV